MRISIMRASGQQIGFTLIELLIALALNLILIGGLFAVYSSSRNTSQTESVVSNVQESLRFGFEYLSYDIRMAGYSGCGNVREVKPQVVADPAPSSFGLNNGFHIRTYDGGSGWVNPTSKPLVTGTDVVTVFHASPDAGVPVSCDPPSNTNANIKVDSWPVDIKDGQALMVTDCSRADVFRVTNNLAATTGKTTISHGSARNTQPAGSACPAGSGKLPNECASGAYTCKSGARISLMEGWTYFIGKNGRGNPSLYRVNAFDSAGTAEELVENIYDFQVVRLGIDGTNDSVYNATAYKAPSAMAAADWPNVVSVEVSIAARSDQPLSDKDTAITAKTYTYDGASVTDRRYRQTQNVLIGLRNLVQ